MCRQGGDEREREREKEGGRRRDKEKLICLMDVDKDVSMGIHRESMRVTGEVR